MVVTTIPITTTTGAATTTTTTTTTTTATTKYSIHKQNKKKQHKCGINLGKLLETYIFLQLEVPIEMYRIILKIIPE